VISSLNPSVFGDTVTFTAVVIPVTPGTGTPTGSVKFEDGTTVLYTATLSGGTATFTTSKLAVGSHTITAVYGGDTDFTGSISSSLNQIVQSSSSAAIAASSVGSGATSITALPTGTSATPSIQDQALEQVSTEHRGNRPGIGWQTAENQAIIRVAASGPRLSRKSYYPGQLVDIGRKGVLTREDIAHENR
jgi:hypothetical protein